MMNWTSNDINTCIKLIDSIVAILSELRDKLFQGGKITQAEFIAIGGIIRKLIDIRDDMVLANIAGILISVDQSVSKVQDATRVIEDRIQTLDEINQIISTFADVINLFSGILGGILTRTIPDLSALIRPFVPS